MSFYLIVIEIKDAMRQPGCLICHVYQNMARRYIKSLIWERVNDYETRKRIIDSLGYCPEHTRLLATTEYSEYGDALGVNIIYENLSQILIHLLETWRPPQQRHKGTLKYLEQAAQWIRTPKQPPTTLSPQATCRVCQIAGESEEHALYTLMEELNNKADEWPRLFRQSDGLCLMHLRSCLGKWSQDYPAAAEFLRQDTLQRLGHWQADISEYIHKLAWDHRDETITDEEHLAWQRTLAFFTGYPPEIFTKNSKRENKDG